LVKELSAGSDMVIGTGGGVVLDADNINDFAASGWAVCINVDPEEILERLEGDGSRPLLAEGDKLEKIKGILDARKHLYASLPLQVTTTGCRVEQSAEKIKAVCGL
jgi:shikimate kinase